VKYGRERERCRPVETESGEEGWPTGREEGVPERKRERERERESVNLERERARGEDKILNFVFFFFSLSAHLPLFTFLIWFLFKQ
jgi:hypothetical protein